MQPLQSAAGRPVIDAAHLANGISTGIAAPLRSHSGIPYSFVGGGAISVTPWISGRTAYLHERICGSGGGHYLASFGENGDVWLLDWDGAMLAPRERDLMFMLGGVLADAQVTAEQQRWFFEGYGHRDIDPIHLAYYRCSWAAQDLADFAARILDQPAGPSSVSSQVLSLFRSLLGRTGIVQLALNSLREIGRGSHA